MPTKIVTAAAVALAVVCPASAETRISVSHQLEGAKPSELPLASLGEVSSGTEASTLTITRLGTSALVSFDLTTKNIGLTEAVVPVRIAAGVRVVGMNATIGGVAMVTQRLLPLTARAKYDAIVNSYRDPALLELVTTDAGVDELSLRVYPLDIKHAAHIKLTLELPSERPEWMTADTVPQHVSQRASLIAIEPAPIGRPRVAVRRAPVVISCGFASVAVQFGALDKTIIRRYVRRNLPRAKGCYDRALLSNKTLTGTVNLHFAVGEDGKTSGISVDGDLPSDDVRACIAADIAHWEFPPVAGGGVTQINYPLTLVPGE